jgi:hypothetical protein
MTLTTTSQRFLDAGINTGMTATNKESSTRRIAVIPERRPALLRNPDRLFHKCTDK